jgi:hypothetical protein
MWHNKKPAKRAQSTSMEFLVGYFIFFLLLTLTVVLWSEKVSEIQYSENFYDREETAVDVAEKLVRTHGVPADWGSQNVTVIGLADEPRVLSKNKIIEFLQIMNYSETAPTSPIYLSSGCANLSNYECNKEVLGVGKYDFYFNLTDINGTVMEINNMTCITGKSPVNETDAITITRTAILDNQRARMKLTLWERTEV